MVERIDIRKSALLMGGVLGISVFGTIYGAAAVSGYERIRTDYHPFFNHISVSALGEEISDRYDPHLVNFDRVRSTFIEVIFPVTLASGVVLTVASAFRRS